MMTNQIIKSSHLLRIMKTYINPHMGVMMTVTEMYVLMTVVRHYHQNMTVTLMAGVIKKMLSS